MVANNIFTLLIFSICSVILIDILPNPLKRYALFILNFLFYFLLSPQCILLILISTCLSFEIGKKIASSPYSKLWFISGILLSVSILIFFKYSNFFLDGYCNGLKLIMPLGLSYYTFKIISYIADIYFRKRNFERSFINYSIYICFFPQIISGPISSSDEILDSLSHLGHPTDINQYNGMSLITLGLFKKIVIADRISSYTNQIFSSPETYPSIALILSSLLYSVQLYCDFSGYSEISIGISQLMGINCSPNFNLPYFSYSIQDFWRNWHISLSSWLRKYIYIPLGGSKCIKSRHCFNVLITFLISGIWHGNSLNYIIWGLFHGICNLFSFKRKSKSKILYTLQIFITFTLVSFGWIIFRSDSLYTSLLYIKHMVLDFRINMDLLTASLLPFTNDYSCLAYFISICLFTTFLFSLELCQFKEKYSRFYLCRNYILVLCIILFGIWGQSNFLYANF